MLKMIIAHKNITKSQVAYFLETGKAPKGCGVNITEDAVCIEPLELDEINLMCEYPRDGYYLVREGK